MADSPPPVLSAATHDELVAVIKDRGYLYSEEPFRLSSGALSHDYVDMRRALSAGPDLALGWKKLIPFVDVPEKASHGNQAHGPDSPDQQMQRIGDEM